MGERQALYDRLAIGQRLAAAYAANENVAAMLVVGSVGRGWSDSFSDLDIDVYWAAPPTDADRLGPIKAVGGTLLGDLDPEEEEEWAEAYLTDNVRVNTSMFLVATLERYLVEVLDEWSVAELPQIRTAALQNGIALHGEALIERWRERAATYPDGLRRAMVRHHIAGLRGWKDAPKLVERGDIVMLHAVIGRAVKAMLGVLHGLNRLYLAHPEHKWMSRLVAGMLTAPPNLADRVASVYQVPPKAAVTRCQTLLEETLGLAQRELPDEDLSAARDWITASR